LRIKRICTHKKDAERELLNLKGFFLNRDYPEDTVERAISKAMNETTDKPTSQITPNNSETKIPSTLIIPYHPRNPRFQQAINELWSRNEQILSPLITKPIVGFTRPKNLRDILTRARYGPPACPSKQSTPHLINRPITTYDKYQLHAPIKHLIFKCQQHQIIHDTFPTLNEGIKSDEYRDFQVMHAECGNTNIIPIEVTHEVTIKCTECNFLKSVHTTKRIRRINAELLNICDSMRNAKLRDKPIHHNCNCEICKKTWHTETITDQRGTNFRLIPFNCQKKNVIYIIHCDLCNINYVGLTTQKLKQRIMNHISNIRTKKNTSVSRHFNQPCHRSEDHLKIAIIDESYSSSNLHIREGLWMSMLGTVTNGINAREEAHSIDYQILNYAKHFQHSKTCLPYMSSRIISTTTLQLKCYKRNLLKPRKQLQRNSRPDQIGRASCRERV
jgi:hypothetical protein